MYVQHKSGQGERWEVMDDSGLGWVVRNHAFPRFFVPKSEYVPCPEWQDITARIEVQDGTYCVDPIEAKRWLAMPNGYRLRKVEVWQTAHNNNVLTSDGKMTAYIVEKLA